MTITIRLLSMLMLVASIHASDAAASWTENRILPPAGTSTFGESVAISRDGNTVLSAAPLENCTSTIRFCGAVYVYVRDLSGWRLQAKLTPSDQVGGSQFGGDDFDDHTIDLSADGNTAIIGINPGTDFPFDSTPRGAVYIFVRNGETWSEQQKLVRPDPSANGFDGFGRSVALADDGNTAVIGDAASIFSLGAPVGSAYVYRRDGSQWNIQTRLIGSANQSRRFGHAVDISSDGGTIAVGAPTESYVFRNLDGLWQEQAILRAADKRADVSFGSDADFSQAIALSGSGDTVLVDRYIFQWDESKGVWNEETKLGSNITDVSKLGFTIDIDSSGQNVVIGDWGLGVVFSFHREAYLNSGLIKWTPERVLAKTGGVGSSVGISGDGNTLLVGYGVYALSRQP